MASFFGPRRDGISCLCPSLGLIATLCLARGVDALDKFWDGGAAPAGLDGVFSDGANWNTTLPPDATDVAHFGVSSPPSPFQFVYTVNFSANANTSSLLLEDDLVTFDLNAHTYTNNHSPFMVATQIGNQSGRFGQLTVNDGLLDINSVVFVGISGGFGNLTISQGGRVESDIAARVGGPGSNGAVSVEGTTSQWVHTGDLSVGWSGTGTMSITGGALVQDNAGLIADGSSPGTVTVSGTNSRWNNSGDLTVGNIGHGILNITSGGQVNTANAVIGQATGSVGEVLVDGPNSKWTSSGAITVSSFSPGTGTLTVANGGTVSVQDFLSVRVLGTLKGDGQIIGDVSNVGVVAPGTSPGALHVTGDFAQGASGKLQIELAGTTAGSQYDQLLLSGAATLDGTLEVSLIEGFSPTVGNLFEVVHANGGIIGGFDTVSLPAIPNGMGWALIYTGVSVFLNVQSATLSGDFNSDGKVDAADYVVWRKTGISGPQGYNDWRAHFGQTPGSGAAARITAVPEPATLVLLMFAAAGSCLRRCRAAWKSPINSSTRGTLNNPPFVGIVRTGPSTG
jgi:T5SS/PEP-CTERM-associated repeat protein